MISIIPRTLDEIYCPPNQERARTPWEFKISLFAKFRGGRGDKTNFLRRCFELDWQMSSMETVNIG